MYRITPYRAPKPNEAILVEGLGVVQGLRRHAAHLLSPGLDAILERLEFAEPLPTSVSPAEQCYAVDGVILGGLEECDGATVVWVRCPTQEGLDEYMRGADLHRLHLPVERRFMTLIDDPHDHWPEYLGEVDKLIASLA